MKVVQINSVYGRGSTGRIAANIHQALTDAGHTSHVVFGRGKPGPAGTRYIGGTVDFLTHVATTLTLDDHGLHSARATRETVAWLQQEQPDLVHLHNIHGFYLHYEVLFEGLRALGKPVVWTLHDCWSFTGHCAYFTKVGCEKWLTGCGRCPQKTAYPPSFVLDRSARNFRLKRDAFTSVPGLVLATPSQWLADLAGRSFLSGVPARVVNNDPDWSVFRPTPSSWRAEQGLDGRFIILAVANIWEERKGLPFLQELAGSLRADETVVVVGRLGLRDRLPAGYVHVPATKDAAELAALYSTADVFVNPTLEDNYPTTNLEAAACGTVPVTFDTGGSGESALRGGGVVTDVNTAAGLRAAIDALRADGVAPLPSGQVRPARLVSDGPGMAANYVALYAKLIGSGPVAG